MVWGDIVYLRNIEQLFLEPVLDVSGIARIPAGERTIPVVFKETLQQIQHGGVVIDAQDPALRRCGDGDVRRADAHRVRTHDLLASRRERSADELHAPPVPQHARRDHERRERDRLATEPVSRPVVAHRISDCLPAS